MPWKIKYGDLFEHKTEKGDFIYIQFVDHEPRHGLQICISYYQIYKERPIKIDDILKGDYVTIQIEIGTGLSIGYVERLGNYPIPKTYKFPKYMRMTSARQGKLSEDKSKNEWYLTDTQTWKHNAVMGLNEEQRKIPPAAIWNLRTLTDRLEKGWRLENWY